MLITIGEAQSPQAADSELGQVLELGVAGAVELRVRHLLLAVEPRAGDEAERYRDERDRGRDGREPAQHPDGHVEVERHAHPVALVVIRHSASSTVSSCLAGSCSLLRCWAVALSGHRRASATLTSPLMAL